VLTYPRETSIAEKFHVMLFRQALNSRMKDYYDIWLLSRSFAFDGGCLGRAIAGTRQARNTPIPQQVTGLQRPFAEDTAKLAQWRAFRRQSGLADAPEGFVEVVRGVAEFLEPVIQTLAAGETFSGVWQPGGPWKQP
jgi:hypothetical protein